jgi:1-acyl-sn-glycerol-3-phosphate acyltransferase
MGRIRGILDVVVMGVARVTLGVFFRHIEVVGAENVPASGPLLVVANHVNNLIDPMLLLAFRGRTARFLAKSTLWAHPVVMPLLALAGALPVYRKQDGEDVRRNRETFDRALRELAAGGAVAIFPEGRSHNEPGGLPLKTGAARIALEATAAPQSLPLRVLPVGLVYEEKERFRSRVLVLVGRPLEVAAEAALYERAPREAVRALTHRLYGALAELVPPFSTWEQARLVDAAVEAVAGAEAAALPLSERWSLWRRFASRHRALRDVDPDRAGLLVEAVRRFETTRGTAWNRVRTVGSPLRRPARWPAGAGLVLWPIHALGFLLNVVPFQLPGWIARRFTRTPDEPATYKILSALLVFPAVWGLEALAAGLLAGPLAALAMAVIAPASGYLALLIHESRPQKGGAPAPPELEPERIALRREILSLLDS